jgi:hypothetical protein
MNFLENEYLLREFLINYILVTSRESDTDHCIVRLIISALATPGEIKNITKRDIKDYGDFQTVRFYEKGNSRIFPIDKRTYDLLIKIGEKSGAKDPIFKVTSDEIDEVVQKYSPPQKRLNARKLRDEVIRLVSDSLFFEDYRTMLKQNDLKKLFNALEDSNPIYSGIWDFEDDEYLKEFIKFYFVFIGERDLDKISERIHEDTERLRKLMDEN